MKYLLGLALAVALLAGGASPGDGVKLAPEAIKQTMEAYIAAFNAGNAAAVTALYQDDATV